MDFIRYVKEINQKGDAFIRSHGAQDFHTFAAETLSQYSLKDHYNFHELIINLFADGSSIQNFKALEFSDLPITVSRGEFCFIDIYFWRRRPTTIHNHHFSGAFLGLVGKNVDLEFSFEPQTQIGRFHELGKISLKREKIVSPGDVVPIAPLDGFIHQNHHQADLTVNLCFRTNELKNQNLSNYLYSGLRYTKNTELLTRSEQLKRLLDMGQINLSDLNLNVDDAIAFLIQYEGMQTGNLALQQALSDLNQKVIGETGVNVPELLLLHDKKCAELEENYE